MNRIYKGGLFGLGLLACVVAAIPHTSQIPVSARRSALSALFFTHTVVTPFSALAVALAGAVLSRGAGLSEEDVPAAHQRLFASYLKSFNAGDMGELKQFASEHLSAQARHGLPLERITQMQMNLRAMAGGGFEVVQTTRNTDTELAVLLKSRGEFPLFMRMVWRFDPVKSDQITGREVAPAPAPEGALGPKLSPEALAKDVDEKLSHMAGEDRFSGSVLIARNGKPLWQKAYGYADREAKTPNTPHTRFRLGSMNKMITSVAIAQLVQAGKIRYSDTLAQILPDYPNKEIAQKITLHQLLTHTSGLGDIFTPEFDRRKDSLHELKDYLPLFADAPLQFEPGKGWSYSNAGFIVLGLVVEKVSGQNYYDYVQHHIYDVAGMKDSGSVPKTDRISNVAIGYLREGPDSPLTPNWDTLPWRGMSAGGGDSTPGDLLKFDQALRSHKLLNPELTQMVLTGKVQPFPSPNQKYAYGFEDTLAGGHHIAGHGGGAPGMNAQLDMYLDNSYTVVVLANLDPPAAQNVAYYIRERLQ